MHFDAGDQALLNETIAYYHDRLKQNPEALAYLAKRGLNHSEMIERFRVGVADRTLGLRLPEKNRKASGEIRGRLQKGCCANPGMSTSTAHSEPECRAASKQASQRRWRTGHGHERNAGARNLSQVLKLIPDDG